MFKKFFIIILLTISYLLLATSCRAQQVTLSFTPPLVETVIKPGKSIMIAYILKNIGDPTIIQTKVLPFTQKDNYGHVRIKDEFEGPIRFSLDNSNMKLGEPFVLKTNDFKQLLLRIRIPEGAPEGDYYYTLLAETQPPTPLDGSSTSQAKATIGANILVTVTNTGSLDIKGKIVTFDVQPRLRLNLFGKSINIFDSLDQIPVTLTLANLGNNLTKPQGTIAFQGNFGERASYDLLPQNILAQSQRLIVATPSAGLNCRENSRPCQIHPSLVINGFFVGRYLLKTNLRFGEQLETLTATTTFFAFPFKIALLLLIIGLVVYSIIKKSRKEEKA